MEQGKLFYNKPDMCRAVIGYGFIDQIVKLKIISKMSSTELFRKHFGEESAAVDLKHQNVEAFFSELNEECLRENEEGNNPYLLSGEELERTERHRIAGGR